MIYLVLGCITSKIDDTSVEEQPTTPPYNTVQTAILHLDEFEKIAIDHGGNRTTGSSGYLASVDYVSEQLSDFGYTVVKQEFFVPTFQVNTPPEVSLADGLLSENDFVPLTYSPAGQGEGTIIAVDVDIPPGSPNSSTSGCQSSDFEGFIEGSVALIQRGSCTFYEKAQNAQNAGAVAVIIFNEGQQGRTGVVDGTLGNSDLLIPVLGTSYDMGVSLVEKAGDSLQFLVDTSFDNVPSYNIIAEYGEGDKVLMVGAHLDSVPDGPGVNDNASGCASILSVAQAFVHNQTEVDHKVRFAFWGAEELGLLGSYHYTENLESAEVEQIIAYLNFDMVGSPNFIRMVYDGDGSESSMSGPSGSDIIEDVFKKVLRDNDYSYTETIFDGRSDYAGFISLGIPAGGLFSGAEGVMSQIQASNFQGEAGESYDPCYHLGCDTRSNINDDGFTSMVQVVQTVVERIALDGLLPISNFVPLSFPHHFDELHHKGGCHQNYD